MKVPEHQIGSSCFTTMGSSLPCVTAPRGPIIYCPSHFEFLIHKIKLDKWENISGRTILCSETQGCSVSALPQVMPASHLFSPSTAVWTYEIWNTTSTPYFFSQTKTFNKIWVTHPPLSRKDLLGLRLLLTWCSTNMTQDHIALHLPERLNLYIFRAISEKRDVVSTTK